MIGTVEGRWMGKLRVDGWHVEMGREVTVTGGRVAWRGGAWTGGGVGRERESRDCACVCVCVCLRVL